MLARTVAKQVAYARVAFGVALLAKPALATAPWLGAVARKDGTRVLSRAFGARDLALGLGAAYALHTDVGARPWLVAAAFSDTVDAAATLGSARSLPVLGRGIVALASVSAAAGAWTASQVE
jgi:hypothetical protein